MSNNKAREHTSPLIELKYYNFANKTIRHIWKLDLKWPDGKKYNPDNIYFTNPNVKEYKPTMCDYGFICDVLDYIEENNYNTILSVILNSKSNLEQFIFFNIRISLIRPYDNEDLINFLNNMKINK